MIKLRPSGYALRKHGAYLFVLAALAFPSCVDDTYDLNDISLKMTLGADGITFPLGKIDQRTVQSMIEDKEIENLITEDGTYAYRLDSTIRESIDAITIDPIRNVIPQIDPYIFAFSDSSFPETFRMEGMNLQTAIALPSLAFGNKPLDGVTVSKPLRMDNYEGLVFPDGAAIILPTLDERDDLAFIVDEIPSEIASVNHLWFGGSNAGTPIRVRFTLGALAAAVKGGTISFELTLPQQYRLRLIDGYGGTASISGSVLRVTDYPLVSNSVDFEFYLTERRVDEPITLARTLEIRDEFRYKFSYSGQSNGGRIPSGAAPLFSLDISPTVEDAAVVTENIVPESTKCVFDVPIEVDGLEAVSRVEYVAFTDDVSNVLVLGTTHSDIPLRGQVPVSIYFPETFVFASGIEGLDGHVLTTTLDRLSEAGGIRLPLEGIRFEGDEAVVRNGVLSADKEVTAIVQPDFPSDHYRLSDIGSSGDVTVDITLLDTDLHIDPQRCQAVVGFSEPIEIVQEIDETFAVPQEVSAITFAEVRDASTGGAAAITVRLDIEDLSVSDLYFDNIEIVLPEFLEIDHPEFDARTHTVHIDRVRYEGGITTIAEIPLLGVRDVPVRKGTTDNLAELRSEVRINASVVVPDGSAIDGIVSQLVTLRPEVSLPVLDVTYVKGVVDIDLQEYLEPTTIDLGDIRESLGDQNIEINLVAPQIALVVKNPVGIAMVGDIVLQPYDFSDQKLDPILVRDVRVEPAEGDDPRITKLFVTDADAAPDGYTLCRVEDLSNLVRIIPSKIDVEFDLHVDDTEEQSFAITGEDYPLDVDYSIRMPLEFKEGGSIDYTDTEDVDDTFEDIGDYEITAEDILIELNARSTLPFALDLSADFLDAEGKTLSDITAATSGQIEGFDASTGNAYRESQIGIRVDIEKGDIQRLRKVAKIRYRFTGTVVGSGAALSPDQYFAADMKLILKKGITFDLDDLMSEEDNNAK